MGYRSEVIFDDVEFKGYGFDHIYVRREIEY